MLVSMNAYTHGITSTTATIALRPANLVELQVQFNFIDLLNHKSNNYSLPLIASLSDDKFGLLYQEVIKLFNKELRITKGIEILEINARFPTQIQMFDLIKREFIEKRVMKNAKNIPYTFDERRFYQVVYFDFLINSAEDIQKLSITFPQPLGTVYVTLTQSSNQEVHKGAAWKGNIKR